MREGEKRESGGGDKPPIGHWQVEFRKCTFAYPSRPDAVVLRDFSLVIEPGQTVALVGPSGSGKSTLVGLLARFYEPLEGEVLVDDVPVAKWNLPRLRDQIGLVQQARQTLPPSTANPLQGLSASVRTRRTPSPRIRRVVGGERAAAAGVGIGHLPPGASVYERS